MLSYILRRALLMIPTLFGILLINFVIIQAAPGGPVEQMIAKIRGTAVDATARFSGAGSDMSAFQDTASHGMESKYQGSRGLDPEFIKQLEKLYGFDKPAHERFFLMVKNYLIFDFGDSYFRDIKVTRLIADKLPVSISLGFWSTLLIYALSIPLGIRKAVKDGEAFDLWTSAVVVVGYAIPSFLFAILLVVLFAGGSFWDLFPLRGLVSEGFEGFTFWGKLKDYVWHLTLPITALVISGFASLTLLTKNSFLEEINKQYVLTARAKGLGERQVLYGHVFRNAMLVVVAGLPGAFMHIFFTGSLLIEVIFSLDGMGLLSFEAAMSRDYPVVFATLYIFTLVGLVTHLVSDILYTMVDPRIDFEKRLS
ncbi:MAG: microcin C ABC transporter permease YejB [Alphaproteobacteria bacterium]|nr:microcin C ABC transporter permease YejB [Alphaproteobacteria bacterium]